ncbi:hypothetical protein GCM10018784_22580 [Streptomyces hydrogenans]|nr:hypothetical protein GCM10018784_22580 [Streptomyces hydrogenans]
MTPHFSQVPTTPTVARKQLRVNPLPGLQPFLISQIAHPEGDVLMLKDLVELISEHGYLTVKKILKFSLEGGCILGKRGARLPEEQVGQTGTDRTGRLFKLWDMWTPNGG